MHEDFRPGELVEIALPDRLAHVQVTHLHASYPPVVRVLFVVFGVVLAVDALVHGGQLW
mgnify:CR=1 FL=1